jgi:hypothetical protein
MDEMKALLEEYEISEVFERLDLTEQEVLEYLVETGFIEWQRLIDAIPLPVS